MALAAPSPPMSFRSWQELVEQPGADRHVVQLYRDESFLQDAVAGWLRPAVTGGGVAIIIGEADHAESVLARLRGLDAPVAQAEAQGRILVLDAEASLARFMTPTGIDAHAFDAFIQDTVTKARAARTAPEGEIRAWGEMVNILWREGRAACAQRLEALWNMAIDAHGFRLLCSYEADHLALDTSRRLHDMCGGHSQVMAEPDYARFEAAVNDALVEIFGEDEAGAVRVLYAKRRVMPVGMPPAQAVLLALQETEPDIGRRVLLATRRRLR